MGVLLLHVSFVFVDLRTKKINESLKKGLSLVTDKLRRPLLIRVEWVGFSLPQLGRGGRMKFFSVFGDKYAIFEVN